MAATAYKGNLTFRGRSGQTYTVPFDADDIVGARIDFPQTGTEHYQTPEEVQLVDIVTTEDGEDTSRIELYVNGMQTSWAWLLGQVVATIPAPRLLAYPRIAAGATVQFFQRA